MKTRLRNIIPALGVLMCAATVAASGPRTVGHRGSSVGVENTREAFAEGIRRGYDFLETDVRVSADTCFVLSHDEDNSRLGGNLKIAEATLSQLRGQTLRQSRYGTEYTATMATLGEYLEQCRLGGVRPVIELKWGTGVNSNDCSLVPALIDTLTASGMRSQAVILTSMRPCLQYIRENYPDIALQFLGGATWRQHFAWADSLRLDFDIAHTYLDSADVARIHAAGLKVNTWTVDNPGRADTLVSYGVDFITTNRLPAEL